MLTHIGAADKYQTGHLPQPEEYSSQNHYHCEGHSVWNKNYIKTYLHDAHEAGATTSLDLGGESTVRFNLDAFNTVINNGWVDILVGNLTEMTTLTSLDDPKAICEKLIDHCRIVVVTLGRQGCYATDGKSSQYYPAKELDESIKPNTTGAGDAFLAGLLAGYHEWQPIKTSVQMATTMAWGAIQGDGCDYWDRVKNDITKIRGDEV